MIARLAAIGPLVMLVMLAAASFWLERVVTTGMKGDVAARHDPDFWAENIVVRKYGADGRLRNTLTAQRMEHFPDDDTTLVDGPVMRYHRQPPVVIFGERGLVSKDGRDIVLLGSATVTREARNGSPPVEVASRVLFLNPDRETAHTTEPVVITQGQSIIHGSGLEADNGTGVTVLHGPVRGTIHRKQ